MTTPPPQREQHGHAKLLPAGTSQVAPATGRGIAVLTFLGVLGYSSLLGAHAQTPLSPADGSPTKRDDSRRQTERPPLRWAPGSWQPWGNRADGAPPTNGAARAPSEPPQASAREFLQRADESLANGRQEAAIENLEQIIERFPASREAGIAKDRLVAQFRDARQKRDIGHSEKNARQSGPSAAPALKAAPQEVKAPPLAAHPANTGAPGGALRRDGDDFKLSVGDRIFFDASTATIEARQRTVLQAQAAWLKARPATIVRIEAHADDPGPREFNTLLARERAEAVRAVLVKEGVSADRIDLVAAGNAKPVARCAAAASELCSSQNRRVVTVIEWLDPAIRRRLSSNGGSQPAALPQR